MHFVFLESDGEIRFCLGAFYGTRLRLLAAYSRS